MRRSASRIQVGRGGARRRDPRLPALDDALLRAGEADPSAGGHGTAREVHGGLGDRAGSFRPRPRPRDDPSSRVGRAVDAASAAARARRGPRAAGATQAAIVGDGVGPVTRTAPGARGGPAASGRHPGAGPGPRTADGDLDLHHRLEPVDVGPRAAGSRRVARSGTIQGDRGGRRPVLGRPCPSPPTSVPARPNSTPSGGSSTAACRPSSRTSSSSSTSTAAATPRPASTRSAAGWWVPASGSPRRSRSRRTPTLGDTIVGRDRRAGRRGAARPDHRPHGHRVRPGHRGRRPFRVADGRRTGRASRT